LVIEEHIVKSYVVRDRLRYLHEWYVLHSALIGNLPDVMYAIA
jgi:hypothetical protein